MEKRTIVIEMDKLLWDDIQRRSILYAKDGTASVDRTWVSVAIRKYLTMTIRRQRNVTPGFKDLEIARFESDGPHDCFASPATPEDQQWLDDFIGRQLLADVTPPDNPRPGDGDGRF